MQWMVMMLAVLTLGGCASLSEQFGARRIEPGETPILSRDEVVIFGRILFFENGKPKVPYAWGRPLWQLERLVQEADEADRLGRPIRLPFLSTRKDAVFVYTIPAGQYQITHIEPFYYLPLIDPALDFAAIEPGRAYYLGDLELEIEVSTWLGGMWGNYITRLKALAVSDRYLEVRGQVQGVVADDAFRKSLFAPIPGRQPQLKPYFILPVMTR